MDKPKLPRMHIEEREGAAHRVPPPDLSSENLNKQTQEAMVLNQAVANLADIRASMYAEVDARLADKAWTPEVLNIIRGYISKIDGYENVTNEEIISATKDVLGFSGFDQVATWVQDDMCSEFFNKALQYCIREGLDHQKEKGFIDGSGIGYAKTYLKDLDENINYTFDAKYHYKVKRLLSYLWGAFGINLLPIANFLHPGHWSYPQGHACKFFTAVQTLRGVFHTDKPCDRVMFIAACVGGHGRDGNFIHYPMDTYASGYTTTLEEFAA